MDHPTLKPISREGIPAALEKAHRYRMMNQPAQAESICLDVLAVDAGNQQALVSDVQPAERLTHSERASPTSFISRIRPSSRNAKRCIGSIERPALHRTGCATCWAA